jgi:hypothetical protein
MAPPNTANQNFKSHVSGEFGISIFVPALIQVIKELNFVSKESYAMIGYKRAPIKP